MSSAQEHGLVPYVDPYKLKRDLAVLEQPIRPTVADIRPQSTLPPNIASQTGSTQLADTQSTATVRSSSTTGGASPTYKDLNEAKRA